MAKTTTATTKKQGFDKVVTLVMSESILKKDRDRKVLTERYGLDGEKPKTLETIGKDLHITRERVRQIEKSAITKIIKKVSEIKEVVAFDEKLEKSITKFGGFVNEERLVSSFIPTKTQTDKEINSFLFLANLNKNVLRHGESKEMRAFRVLKSTNSKKIHEASKAVDKIFEGEKKVKSASEIAKNISKDIEEVESLLWTKKNVLQTEDKKWGLITWREVNPKSIRDKTYVILKKHKEPLHYSDIAQKISEHKLQKRPVTRQAVHNELIRDDRFVLIGRGIYALNEWGYRPGVVEDVIREIMKEQGRPMHKNEIIEHVKKQRIVKETTVILNLQKDSFKRVARATYTLKEED